MEKPEKPEERQEEYAFSGLRFFPNQWRIDISNTEKSLSLTKVQREFLLILVKNANRPVSYDELRQAVWSHEPEVDSRVIHNIHVTKSKLTSLLESCGIDSSIIESIESGGYRLNAEVTVYSAYHESLDNQQISQVNRTIIIAPNTPTGFSTTFAEAPPSPEKTVSNKKTVFGAIAAVVLIILIWQVGAIFHQPALRLEKAEFVSNPIPGVEFLMSLKGSNFAPETVRLKVRGPGCGGDDPCIVSNGALRLYGGISETTIEKAPLKLARGDYQIWLENELGYTSNQLTITVPDANP